MYKPLLFILISLSVGTISNGQNPDIEKRLDQLLSAEFNQKEPGCAILVAKDGNVVYKKAFGTADVELDVPLAPGMVFKLASITKQFTAIAILQLVEQRKISLEDSLQKFVPDFPSHGQRINIENLLTHTSGIKDYMQIEHANQYMERWDFTPKQLIDHFKNHPLEFEPGTRYSYSNSGYYLLGYIVERVSGKSYQSYVKDNILTPLGMSETYFDTDNNIIPRRVKGYRKDNGKLKNADYWSPTIAYAAGGLLSTTGDLLKWFNGILAHKIIIKETLDKAFTPYKLRDGSQVNYGYGWYIENTGKVRSIEHAGKMNGFLTNQIYYPEQNVFIAALFNSENAPRDEMSRKISEIVLGQSLQTESSRLDVETMCSYIGTYSLTTDSKRTITVELADGRLFAKVGGQSRFELLFQTPVKFQFRNVKDMTGEFIKENGRVVRILVNQNGQFVWQKTW